MQFFVRPYKTGGFFPVTETHRPARSFAAMYQQLLPSSRTKLLVRWKSRWRQEAVAAVLKEVS